MRELIDELAGLEEAARALPAAARTHRARARDPNADRLLARQHQIILELHRRRSHYRRLTGVPARRSVRPARFWL